MKHFFLGFCSLAALLLSACGSPSIPAEDPRTFSGTVQGYTGGAAGLAAVVLLEDSETTLGSGSIEANGSFSYELPETVSAEGLQPVSSTFCEGLSFSNKAQVPPVFSLEVMSGGTFTGFLGQATSAGVISGFDLTDDAIIVRRIYSDREVTVAGTCDFSPDTYDLRLRQGWNIVLERFNEVEPGAFGIDSTVGAVPAAASWFFVAE